jgi:RHS repeat-associated protein
VTTSGGDAPVASAINSNDLLRKVIYPLEAATGGASEADRTVWHAWNRQGELMLLEDQNDTRHTYTRDSRGRVTRDAATNLGGGIDATVRALGMAYDDAGRLEKATSYGDTAATITLNEAQFGYTGLWQVSHADQDHNGAVTLAGGGGSPTGDTRRVSYGYDTQKFVDGSQDNFSRVTQLTYPGPSAHSIDYGYDKAPGVADANSQISRLMRISSSTPAKTYALYDYVGLGTAAVVDIDAVDVQLDRTASADGKRNAAGYATGNAGVYPGFDRFGRVVRHAWLDGDYTTTGGTPAAPTKVSIVEQSHTYDRASNRLTSYDVRPGATTTLSHAYTYDDLHRLDKAERGTWSPGSPGTFTLVKNSQDWSLDLLGNWQDVITDLNGDGTYSATTEKDERTHNGVNELTKRLLKGQGPSAGDLTLDPITHDANGNVLSEQRQIGGGATELTWTYIHDAWNRLAEIKNGSNTKARYRYNALNWRTLKAVDTDDSGGLSAIDLQHTMYYSPGWQLLEERIDTNVDGNDDQRKQYIWGARYIDDIIHSRLDANIDGDFTDPPGSGDDLRYYHLTDVQFSTVALTSDRTTRPTVLERVTYSAYGKARHHRFADLSGDGSVNGADLTILNAAFASPAVHIADLNRDGNVTGTDTALLLGDWAAAADEGVLSLHGNTVGWDGYLFNPESAATGGQYHVRHRVYDPVQGRWLERDSAGYINGLALYEYCRGNSVIFIDPSGRWLWVVIGGVVGGVAGGIMAAMEDDADAGSIWAGIGGGVVTGVAISSGAGIIAGALSAGTITTGAALGATAIVGGAGGALGTTTEQILDPIFHGEDLLTAISSVSFEEQLAGIVSGAVGGVLGTATETILAKIIANKLGVMQVLKNALEQVAKTLREMGASPAEIAAAQKAIVDGIHRAARDAANREEWARILAALEIEFLQGLTDESCEEQLRDQEQEGVDPPMPQVEDYVS